MSRVASQLTSLRYLNMRYCPRITDATVLAFGRKIAGLYTLNLSHVSMRISRLGTLALSRHSPPTDWEMRLS